MDSAFGIVSLLPIIIIDWALSSTFSIFENSVVEVVSNNILNRSVI